MTRAHRSRIGRPYRRLRRWARNTPNGTVALNLFMGGFALIALAAILAFVLL